MITPAAHPGSVPAGLRWAFAWAAFAAAAGVAAWHLPDAGRSLNNRIAVGERRTAAERAIPAADVLGIDAAALDRVAALVPEDAVYAVHVARGPGVGLGELAFPSLAANRLLPRRQSQDAQGADWVVAYGADPAGLGVDFARVVPVGGDVVAAEVAR